MENLEEKKLPDTDNKKIEELLQENLMLNREIHEICLNIKRYMYAAQIYGIIKTIVIIVPIIIAIFLFLPLFRDILPQAKDIMTQYKELMGPTSSSNIQSFLK